MKSIKHIITLVLSITMIFSLVIASGVTTVSALPGAGIQKTSFRSYGIDVSYWNVAYGSSLDFSRVNFAKLKADGCQFVILRLGYEGSSNHVDTIDTSFLEFYKRARAAGMPLGLYFYGLSTTKAGAINDAQFVIKTIEDNNMYFEYPIYYDVEDSNQVALGSSAMEALCLGWCETLEAAGYFPGIYGGGSQVIDKLSSSFKSKYDLWYPRYKSNYEGNQHAANAYDFSDYCGMWQHAIFGYYDGLASSSVDMNVCYKDYPAIMKQYGYNNCGESAEKTALREVVAQADTLRSTSYSDSQINAIRTAYNNAVSALNNSSATAATLTSARDALYNAINNTSNIRSKGKKYTVSVNSRTDKWKDDGVRLTDGKMGTLPGDTDAYSGLGSADTVDITVDLGAATTHNVYRVYTGVNASWGIGVPSEVKISVSSDGTNFTEISTDTAVAYVATSDPWKTYLITAYTDSNRTERYVRFSVTPRAGKHIWLDEVAVLQTDVPNAKNAYVDAVNKRVTSGSCNIFTPSFGTITTTNANHAYTRNIIAKWDSAKSAYVVKSTSVGTGTATPSITLASDEILIAAHNWESASGDDSVPGSYRNHQILSSLKVGDILTLGGINVASNTRSVASYVKLYNEFTEPAPLPDNLAVKKDYTTSDIYKIDGAVAYPDEGGTTMTDGKNAPVNAKFNDTAFIGFNINSDDYKEVGYSSITVDLGDKYSVNKFIAHVASSYNGTAGIHAPKTVSVYVSDDNESWQEAGETSPTDTTAISTVSAVIALDESVNARYVQFRFESETNWIFVSEVEVYEGAPVDSEPDPEPEPEPDPEVLLGDVDIDGDIDAVDYLLVKRYCLGTYDFDEDAYVRADFDENASVNSVDYLLIKRVVLGTYGA